MFDSLDKDHSGSLNAEEFERAGEALWEAVRGGAEENVKKDVREMVARHAPAMRTLMGKMGAEAVSVLAEETETEARGEWVRRMFGLADKDGDGGVSFDEFRKFFLSTARRERAAREEQLRDLIAENLDSNEGRIDLRVVSRDGLVKSVQVNVPGMTGDEIRGASLVPLFRQARNQFFDEFSWEDFGFPIQRGYELTNEKRLAVVALLVRSTAPSHTVTVDGHAVAVADERKVEEEEEREEKEEGLVRLRLKNVLVIAAGSTTRLGVCGSQGKGSCTKGDPAEVCVGHGVRVTPRSGPHLDTINAYYLALTLELDVEL